MKYGLFGKFLAQPGKRDELAQILLQAAELLKENPECLSYIISTNDDKDAVWISEVWTTEKAHDNSLEPENIRNLIKQAMPLIASTPPGTKLTVLGGKGL